jgi:hypothetical protein
MAASGLVVVDQPPRAANATRGRSTKIPARCATTFGCSKAIRLIRPIPTHPNTPSS